MPSTSPSDPPPSYSSQPTKDSHHHHHHHDAHHDHKNSSKASANTSGDVGNHSTSGMKEQEKESTSSSSHRHSSSKHRSKKHVLSQDEILSLARRGMPRSKFGPEFLKSLSKHGLEASSSKGMPKFRVITGAEAAKMYNEAIREDERERDTSESHDRDHHHSSASHSHSNSRHVPNHYHHNPVVFAFPGGSKVVDYYMTWRGKTGTRRLKGHRRRHNMLDEEFLKLQEGLEKEYKYQEEKRNSYLGVPEGAGAGESTRLLELEPEAGPSSRPGPTVTTGTGVQSAPSVLQTNSHGGKTQMVPEVVRLEEEEEGDDDLAPLPPSLPHPARPVLTSRESNSSVISLPYLGMVRGVPLGNRVPLRVMNPDAASSTDSRRGSVVSTALAQPGRNSENSMPVPLDGLNHPNSHTKPSTRLVAVQEDDAHSEEDGNLTALLSRKGSKGRRHPKYHLTDSSSASGSPQYDSRSLSGSSSSSHGTHGEKEILIVLMDEKDPSLKDVKPPNLTAEELKLMRKSSTKPPTREVSLRQSTWDGPAASVSTPYGAEGGLLEAKRSTRSVRSHLYPEKANGNLSRTSSNQKYLPSRSPYSHSHSSHSSYSSLLGDDDDSDWDTEDSDDDDRNGSALSLSLKAALEALRFNSRGYTKTPSPRRTPSGGYVGLPPMQNPGTTIIVPTSSPYVAPGMAQLASQHASPYVNHNTGQIHPSVHMSPASSYGLAALYSTPYMAQSAPNLPQSQTPRGQLAQLVQGQSPYVTPYIAISPDHAPNQRTPIYPPGLTLHPTPHNTPAGASAALIASTYTSPYVTQAQAPLPPLGGPVGTSGIPPHGSVSAVAAAAATGTSYVSPYTTPSHPAMPLYGSSVHGTPYSTGAGQDLYGH